MPNSPTIFGINCYNGIPPSYLIVNRIPASESITLNNSVVSNKKTTLSWIAENVTNCEGSADVDDTGWGNLASKLFKISTPNGTYSQSNVKVTKTSPDCTTYEISCKGAINTTQDYTDSLCLNTTSGSSDKKPIFEEF